MLVANGNSRKKIIFSSLRKIIMKIGNASKTRDNCISIFEFSTDNLNNSNNELMDAPRFPK